MLREEKFEDQTQGSAARRTKRSVNRPCLRILRQIGLPPWEARLLHRAEGVNY